MTNLQKSKRLNATRATTAQTNQRTELEALRVSNRRSLVLTLGTPPRIAAGGMAKSGIFDGTGRQDTKSPEALPALLSGAKEACLPV
jgi:hypothetical protein